MALSYEQGRQMLRSKLFSDSTIVCGAHIFKVHRLALYPKSAFFQTCIGGGFKESQDGVLHLNDHKPRVVAHMILCTYLGQETQWRDIDEVWPELRLSEKEHNTLDQKGIQDLHYVELYELAVFLMYDELKNLAQTELLKDLKFHWHQVKSRLHHTIIPATSINDITRMLHEVYTRIPAQMGSLRLEVTAMCIENYCTPRSQQEELRAQEYVKLREIWSMVKRHELFAWQLGLRLQHRGGIPVDYLP